jgi:hypothetical protein
VAEGSGLLNRHTASSRIVSSNLIPSAKYLDSSHRLVALQTVVRQNGMACKTIGPGVGIPPVTPESLHHAAAEVE